MTVQHIMLDIETLGTRPGSIVLTIGAVKFSKGGLGDAFYRSISKADSFAHGLTRDPATVEWWQQQSEEAREAALAGMDTLQDTLKAFTEFCTAGDPLAIAMWGNGSDLDNVLLEEAYWAAGMKTPWRFTGNRCYRTVKNLFPDVQVDPVGTTHNALDDATYQANHLIAISNFHGLNLA